MFPEYSELISRLQTSDRHFSSMLEKHSALEQRLRKIEARHEAATDAEIEVLKKKKLLLKDEVYDRLRKAAAS